MRNEVALRGLTIYSAMQEKKRTQRERFERNADGTKQWSSYKERKGDALALGAEEGRSDLRKATGSRKQAVIRGYPNGETRQESKPVTVY